MMPLDKSRFITKLKRLEEAKERLILDSARMTEIIRIDEKRPKDERELASPQSRKFFNSQEKYNLARITNINKQIRSHEAIYNARQRIWRDYEDALIIAEDNFDIAKKTYDTIHTQYTDCKTNLLFAGTSGNEIDMKKYGSELQTLHYDLLQAVKTFDIAERKLNILRRRSVQELPPLDILREQEAIQANNIPVDRNKSLPGALGEILTAAINKRDGIVITKEIVETESPLDIIRQPKEFIGKYDKGIRAVKQSSPNPMEEMLKMDWSDLKVREETEESNANGTKEPEMDKSREL